MTDDLTPEKSAKFQQTCTMLYIVYAVGAVLQFFDGTMLAGIFALVVAGILANRNKKTFKGTIFESHLRWMNRSLWIGGLVLTPVAIVLTGLLLFIFTDAATFVHELMSGNADLIMGATQRFLTGNFYKISVITELTTALPVLWFLRRCYRGYEFARADLPVENVKSWR